MSRKGSFETLITRETPAGEEIELTLNVDVSIDDGSGAHFDVSFGNYLPGDPYNVDVEKIQVDTGRPGRARWTKIELGDAEYNAIVAEAAEQEFEPYTVEE